MNWIEFLLQRWASLLPQERPFDRILLVRIEPAPTVDDGTVPNAGGLAGGLAGWFRWLTGPVETIVNVRSASQLERGNLESDLAALYLELKTEPDAAKDPKQALGLRKLLGSRRQLPIADKNIRKPVAAAFKPGSADQPDQQASQSSNLPVVVVTVRFQKQGNGNIPLNWKLSTKQKHWYKQAWKDVSQQGGALADSISAFFEKAAQRQSKQTQPETR